jgi:hypothetical protein
MPRLGAGSCSHVWKQRPRIPGPSQVFFNALSVSGNWDRLHELITHWGKKSQPPATWGTILAVTAIDKRRDLVPDYTDAYDAALASGETTNAPARKSSPVLDLTGQGEKSQTSENTHSPTTKNDREASPESKRPTPVKAAARKVVKQHMVQRRPSERKPGRATVRRAGEPPSIPKDDACASLPGAGSSGRTLRPDHLRDGR